MTREERRAAREAQARTKDERLLAAVPRELQTISRRLQLRKAGRPGSLGTLVETRGKTWREIRAGAIAAMMESTRGNRHAAVRQLKIGRQTLLKMLKDYGLQRVGVEGRKTPRPRR